ncbi:MAG: SDR family oxidoreductase [Zhengella sp.]|uniref:D-erythronate dehydrogenase n=1 Tax=Zhengella sp. TaxID=2282762 RepID=UPI001D82B81B|nr:SDR family oxidoreductase [Notoacmeibacter sp.]MCC0027722.1 SDR family oxidoreductase [Brucellaceae bacterium]
MNFLIIGGAGMVGQKLARAIAAGGLAGTSVTGMVLHDIVAAKPVEAGFPVTVETGNFADAGECGRLAAARPDIVFHLAAIVSGDAEQNFRKGWDINARGSWHLLEALRAEHEASAGSYRPRVVFTSSIAVFGPPFPAKIGDDFLCAPQTSYGAQKAMTELLVADYARKGIIDGLSIRLPTICVRPGKPNLAASSFFSGIIREPLNGQEAILPVDDDVRHWHASPRSAAGFLIHAATLDTNLLEGRRSLNMPGVSCTVAEQIEALRMVAGDAPVALIRRQPDETIRRIVAGWPRDFDPARAIALGFRAESSFEDIIRIYVEDDLDAPKA